MTESQSVSFSNRPTHRVVMLGDQGVGKSSISLRFVRDEFYENNAPTIGAAYLTNNITVGEQTIKLDLWDTAGQERFASLAPMYYRTAQAAVVVYDICNKASFNRALEWVKELKAQAPPSTVIVLAGNKSDMALECRQVFTADAAEVAHNKGLLFMEVSAKTGQGVSNVFMTIGERLAGKADNNTATVSTNENNIRLSRDNASLRSKCPC